MKIKNKNLFIILFIMLVSLFAIITFFIYLQKRTSNIIEQNEIIDDENSNIINTVNQVSNSITNEISSAITNELNVITPEINTQNEVKSSKTTISSNISNSKTNSSTKASIKDNTSSNNHTQINSKPTTSQSKNTEEKNNIETADKNNTHTNTSTSSTTTAPSKPTKDDNARPELANTTYRKTNTANVQEIINILNSEIAKDKELVEFGSKTVKGNKSDAYAKTTAFTYLFVNDIQKGKVKGNYTAFPQRVKNNVGAFGTYYVYAEDEYTYDGRGLNPKWSQTLVWIYVEF